MVNNAGIMGAMGYMDEMGLPEFEATLAVNLTSVFLGSKHAIRWSSEGEIPHTYGCYCCE